ncbi:MAG: DUF4340 domain-containing protein [Myxococcales bacterium]|nr:DUF4340 domain-containing protein [Myxococcales bacterium]
MKRQGSLVALAVVAVVVAALLWLDARRPSTDETVRERRHLLVGFDRARATELEIERRGVVTKLRHEASGWWLVASVDGRPRRRADDSAVDSLLSVLEYGEIDRRIRDVDASLRKKLGLDPPRVVVRVAGHTLRIGGDDPSHGVYVARDDDPGAFVAEHRLVETADLDPRLWLSMRVTLRDPSEAKTIATNGWTFERAAGWRVTQPAIARAADAKVDALVQALERTRAVAEAPARPPVVGGTTLALDGEPQARIAGDAVDRADGARLTIRASDLNLLAAPAATYYERRLFPLRLDDLVAVDVGPLRLRRDAGAWRIVAPAAAVRAVDDAKVRGFVEPLLAAQARSFSTAPQSVASTTGAHAIRVRLATRDEEVTAAVDGARAVRANETVTLELAAPLELSTSF